MSFVRYVLWHPENRKGEFEFLCSTQENWTRSKEGILKEYKEIHSDLLRDEVVPKMYKLTIEEIKP